MKINEVEPRDFLKAVTFRRFQALCGFNSWPDPWIDLHDAHHSSEDVPRGGNLSGWHSKELDRLLDDMQVALDPTKRTVMHHRFNQIFHDQQPETLLVHNKVGVLVHKRFENVNIRPTGLQSFDLWVRPENVLHGKTMSK